MSRKIQVFCDVTPCRRVNGFSTFRSTFRSSAERTMALLNVRNHSPNDRASHAGELETSLKSLKEPSWFLQVAVYCTAVEVGTFNTAQSSLNKCYRLMRSVSVNIRNSSEGMKKVRASPLGEIRIKPGCELHGGWNLVETNACFLDDPVEQRA